MEYARYKLNEEIVIDQLITFYYMELPVHFHAEGEAHNFWEFVYVDKGEIEILTDSDKRLLHQGEIVFYKPNQFHAGEAKAGSAPNLVIVSFECANLCMEFFQSKIFELQQKEKDLLSRIMEEGFKSFSNPVVSPRLQFPDKREDAPFASEQIIKNYLEILLIQLIRKGKPDMAVGNQAYTSVNRGNASFIDDMIGFLEQNLSRSLSPSDLCGYFKLSRTCIMETFKRETGMSIMKYFNKLKIDKAKEMIRCNKCNFSQISDMMGFSSVHYFSKLFKTLTGMTPSEYSNSVKAMIY